MLCSLKTIRKSRILSKSNMAMKRIPLGFHSYMSAYSLSSKGNVVYKLKKASYGVKENPRARFENFSTVVVGLRS